jgi:two-component system OmpR family sensor kinase
MERLRFLQRLDHELKNPLTAMQIALANLVETHDAQKRHEISQGMQGQILRIGHLISDLRKLAMLERGPIEKIPVNVSEMLHEVTLVIQDGLDIHTRHLTLDFDDSLPMVMGDRDLLQLAVYNVLDNAVKFTQPQDTIELSAHADNDHLVIQIEDSGPGIPAEDLPHVCEDLYRSQQAHGIPGSGIGLAMVRGIIERHDGEVAIESWPGQGTLVTLTLPVTETSA